MADAKEASGRTGWPLGFGGASRIRTADQPLALRWSDLNFQWRLISIKDKVEGERVIGLMPYVAKLLLALPQRTEWVFSSATSKSGALVDPGDVHDAACKAAGCPR